MQSGPKPHFVAWVWLYNMDRDWMVSMPTMHPMQPEAVPLYYDSLRNATGTGTGWKISTHKKPLPAGRVARVAAGFFFIDTHHQVSLTSTAAFDSKSPLPMVFSTAHPTDHGNLKFLCSSSLPTLNPCLHFQLTPSSLVLPALSIPL